ncbi:DUF6975 family protein [Sphingomonas sp. PR090111-T3T-6A]|uniref:DUF6975 family protein n=1 Tax=Sphingomonas sp. PR090111-T3T-6A TaxID=685778 RepID=UPI0003A4197D|nr:hypothetical protein [Sphingomonas sp. PR090111-T3T-6A]
MTATARSEEPEGVGARLSALLSAEGSAQHPYCSSPDLLTGEHSARNLADAAHFLSMLHGRHPGVSDHAAHRIVHPAARAWIYRVTAGFSAERTLLTKLAVAVGPLPSTLGQAQSEAAVAGQTHALATLAQSDRNGTALGATLALTLDWRPIRRVLDAAAERFDLQPPPLDLPGLQEALDVATRAAETPGIERAILFGAQQLLIQHRGLWDLLETRHTARRDG